MNEGFFSRHLRRVSSGLTPFYRGSEVDRYAEKEKLGRGRLGLDWDIRHWRSEDWKEMVRRILLLSARKANLSFASGAFCCHLQQSWYV